MVGTFILERVLNRQPLAEVLTCLGDGHDGIWNIVSQLAPKTQRREVLDWFHLIENLHKVGGSLKRLKQAEELLWRGQMEAAKALFVNCKLKQAQNFCQYLNKHRHRIINYQYHQAEQICKGWFRCSGINGQANWPSHQTLRSAVEARKCASSAGSSLCLPQWANLCLMNKKWDAPETI